MTNLITPRALFSPILLPRTKYELDRMNRFRDMAIQNYTRRLTAAILDLVQPQKMNMSIFRRSRIVVESQLWYRLKWLVKQHATAFLPVISPEIDREEEEEENSALLRVRNVSAGHVAKCRQALIIRVETASYENTQLSFRTALSQKASTCKRLLPRSH